MPQELFSLDQITKAIEKYKMKEEKKGGKKKQTKKKRKKKTRKRK